MRALHSESGRDVCSRLPTIKLLAVMKSAAILRNTFYIDITEYDVEDDPISLKFRCPPCLAILYIACVHLASEGHGVQAGQGQNGLGPKTAEA